MWRCSLFGGPPIPGLVRMPLIIMCARQNGHIMYASHPSQYRIACVIVCAAVGCCWCPRVVLIRAACMRCNSMLASFHTRKWYDVHLYILLRMRMEAAIVAPITNTLAPSPFLACSSNVCNIRRCLYVSECRFGLVFRAKFYYHAMHLAKLKFASWSCNKWIQLFRMRSALSVHCVTVGVANSCASAVIFGFHFNCNLPILLRKNFFDWCLCRRGVLVVWHSPRLCTNIW